MSRRLFFKLSASSIACLLSGLFSGAVRGQQLLDPQKQTSADIAPKSIAFGSCNHTHLPQPMWSHIYSRQPDLFLWLGDVVYADTNDVQEMLRHYRVQYSHPEYQQVRTNMPVIGIWDDHDYGGNNLGRDNPIKEQGQQLFLDFLDVPAHSRRRQQSGIYTSYTYGSGDSQVKLILLDTRYHRDRGGRGRADLLGRDQWRWLEAELRQTTASVNLIASGSSVLSTQIPGGEEWEDYRWEKRRLFHLIKKHRVSGVMFLTGDRHFAAHLTEKVSGRTYHELMSSGLTHYLTRPKAKVLMEYFLGRDNCYFGTNFGLLHFNWVNQVTSTFEVFDKNNQKRLNKTFSLVDGSWEVVKPST